MLHNVFSEKIQSIIRNEIEKVLPKPSSDLKIAELVLGDLAEINTLIKASLLHHTNNAPHNQDACEATPQEKKLHSSFDIEQDTPINELFLSLDGDELDVIIPSQGLQDKYHVDQHEKLTALEKVNISTA